MRFSPGLQSVLDYHLPYASKVEVTAAGVRLDTPETNILALNSTYFDGGEATGLTASSHALPGREVARLRTGVFSVQVLETGVTVEQVSRLQLPVWAEVLARAHGTPGWAPYLARHFAVKLEGDHESVLLLAYLDSAPLGALLWRAGAAHLWGSVDGRADVPLLNTAAELSGGQARVSLPPGSLLPLQVEEPVSFTLCGAP